MPLLALVLVVASATTVYGCADWCNAYTCGLSACSQCATTDPAMCGPDQCHSWCNAYTCGSSFCTSCPACISQAQAFTHCSWWCNSYTCGSGTGFFATQCGGCDVCKPPACTASRHLRSVIHKFKSDADVQAWYAYFGQPSTLSAFFAQNAIDGVYMHYFMPSTDGLTINCLWETNGCWSDEYFQMWIDGPTGPGLVPPGVPGANPNVFINTPHKGTTAIAPPNHFLPDGTNVGGPPTGGKDSPCKPIQGSLFFVRHTYKPNPAAVDWVNGLATFSPPNYATYNFGNDVSNPQFILLDTNTTTGSPTPDAMCVWETKNQMTPAEFQAYIDGPTGPGSVRGDSYGNTPYDVFVNEVFPVGLVGGVYPCSAF